ncbi:hypothetical protein [Streptomyces bugieae]|uniref:Uncharacterized protein n=1 Tax=Streptomyces bugieae TaxID=3098223 RepID=A0ABU7NP63_9ACTN|nr:hypothetical protein [Streptomyces sp. DSM 41528]
MDAVDGGRSRRLPVLVPRKTAVVVITAKSAGRKVFGLATAGVRLA